jgi:spermidine synthase
VVVVERDVAEIIATGPSAFDAILLDVDNGPAALTVSENERLYGPSGLATIHRCLKPGGVLGVWSADPDRVFEKRLAKTGFKVFTETVSARRGAKGPKHTIFIGKAP